jgi:ubiquinone/menaquinone biosynthesis C-methylase UbiE
VEIKMTLVSDTIDVLAGLSETERPRAMETWGHWESSARAHGQQHSASWGDRYAIELEVRNLLTHLRPSIQWLDAGCANGYTTYRVLRKKPASVFAFDYSPTMIDHARRLQPLMDPQNLITFEEGNLLEIPCPSESIDQAYTVRVVINLPSWEAQKRAIREIHRVLKPGGSYILSEAFAGSQDKLNTLRALAGLSPLQAPQFNQYLVEEDLEAFARDLFDIVRIERFSSFYYLASRFLRELAVAPDAPPSYDHPLNTLAAQLSPSARPTDFGIQKAYILAKR